MCLSIVRIYADHKHLLCVFAPLNVMAISPRYVLTEVYRSAIRFLLVNFIIEHVNGTRNVFAELLER